MLREHPEIRALYGHCPRTKYVCSLLVLAQLSCAYLLRDAAFGWVLLVAYGFGGFANQALLLAIHELSHNLAFKSSLANRLFALFVNLPIGIPVAASFRYYHLLHHAHQGVEGVDTDLPTALEARLLRSPIAKLVWLAGQGLAYGLRPLFVHPKRPDAWEIANFGVQLAFDVVLVWVWGWTALAYLPLSALIGMGLHPIAGHFIAEHYVFRPGQETYSYYGPLNRLAFNVGYHNEHHDFPAIAGSRLPELRRLAPEYYAELQSHRSWTRVLWDFVTRADLGGYSRVKRASSKSVSAP